MYFPPGKAGNVLRGALGTISTAFNPKRANLPSGLAEPPRPFVLRASHLDGKRFGPGETFAFEVNVFDLLRTADGDTRPGCLAIRAYGARTPRGACGTPAAYGYHYCRSGSSWGHRGRNRTPDHRAVPHAYGLEGNSLTDRGAVRDSVCQGQRPHQHSAQSLWRGTVAGRFQGALDARRSGSNHRDAISDTTTSPAAVRARALFTKSAVSRERRSTKEMSRNFFPGCGQRGGPAWADIRYGEME